MRKGHLLEREINKFLVWLDAQGIHGHKNNSSRTIDGIFLKGEPFDYEIIHNNRIYCFDAKECHADTWKPTNLIQQNNLIKCKRHGAIAFYLIYFYKTKKLCIMDCETLEMEEIKNIKMIIER